MYDLAARFTQIRKEKGLTQKQVATQLDVAEQSYQFYEYGKHVPSALVLCAIADIFNVSLDYLVGRSDNPNSHKDC